MAIEPLDTKMLARLWADQLEKELAATPSGDQMIWIPRSAIEDVAKVLRECSAELSSKGLRPHER